MQLLSWSAFGQSGFELLRRAVISRVGLMRAEIRAYTYLYGVQYGVHGLECRHGRKMGVSSMGEAEAGRQAWRIYVSSTGRYARYDSVTMRRF